jgi:hypothetical protein
VGGGVFFNRQQGPQSLASQKDSRDGSGTEKEAVVHKNRVDDDMARGQRRKEGKGKEKENRSARNEKRMKKNCKGKEKKAKRKGQKMKRNGKV